MFLPRAGLRNQAGLFTNTGSIRDNLDMEEEMGGTSQSKKPLPGPGQYNVERSSFSIDPKPRTFQNFGSNSGRFNEPTIGSDLGPGQYRPHRNQRSNMSIAGTQSFKTPAGREPFNIEYQRTVPGPGEYNN